MFTALILVSASSLLSANVIESLRGTTFSRLPDGNADDYDTNADGTIHLGNWSDSSKVIYRFYLPPAVGSNDITYLRVDTYGTGDIDNIKTIVNGNEYLIASDVNCRWQRIFSQSEINDYAVLANDAVGGRIFEIQIEVVKAFSECFLEKIEVSINYGSGVEHVVENFLDAYSCYLAFDEASKYLDVSSLNSIAQATTIAGAIVITSKALIGGAIGNEIISYFTNNIIDQCLGINPLFFGMDTAYFIANNTSYPLKQDQIGQCCHANSLKAKDLAILWKNGLDGLSYSEATLITNKLGELRISFEGNGGTIGTINSAVNSTLYPTYLKRWDPGDGSPASSQKGDVMAEILMRRIGVVMKYDYDQFNSPQVNQAFSTVYEYLRICDQQIEYLNSIFPAVGTLNITLIPSSAQWRLYGNGKDYGWKGSGVLVSNIPVGNYTLEFSSISGFITPLARQVSIGVGNNSMTVNYQSGKTTKLYPWYDTFVNEHFPTSKFYSAQSLQIDNIAYDKYAYFGFKLNGIPLGSVINDAELHLWYTCDGTAKIDMYDVENNVSGGNNDSITWNNRPSLGNNIGELSMNSTSGNAGHYTVRCGSVIQSKVDDDDDWEFCMKNDNASSIVSVSVMSDEWSFDNSQRPYLTVSYNPPPIGDLIVSDNQLSPSASLYDLGQAVTCNVAIQNISSMGYTESCEIQYYLGVTSADLSNPIGEDDIDSLPPGGTVNESCTYTFQSSDVGQRYLICKVNHNGLVDESDYSNNIKAYGV